MQGPSEPACDVPVDLLVDALKQVGTRAGMSSPRSRSGGRKQVMTLTAGRVVPKRPCATSGAKVAVGGG